MIEIEPILEKFAIYGFRDEQGHPLEKCADFQELAFLAIAKMQECWTEITDDPATWPPLKHQVWFYRADRMQEQGCRTGDSAGWNHDYVIWGRKYEQRVTHWRYLPLSPGVESDVTLCKVSQTC